MKTLARLSFLVSSDGIAAFEDSYEKMIVPLFEELGLVESALRSRPTAGDVFSRLFEFDTRAEMEACIARVEVDEGLEEVLHDLGTNFGTPRPDGFLPIEFEFYSGPVGSGKVVSAESGKRVSAGRGTGHWRSYDIADGIAGAWVSSILQDRQGRIWFGTRSGACCYDGREFATFTTDDGLSGDCVMAILEDRQGRLWFGTENEGICRYDGREFVSFSTDDGLAHNQVWSMLLDREGQLWFATMGGGVSCYDGQKFTTFTSEDGLAHDTVLCMQEDRLGAIWFGTEEGISCYDGNRFKTFKEEDGLAHNTVLSAVEDNTGRLWFGTKGGGASCYDGKSFTTFTSKQGLAHDEVWAMALDSQDRLWFGTWGGVSRYDGQEFVSFTSEDGLALNTVWSVLLDREGHLWLATMGGGVSCYDESFITFTAKDGLAYDDVSSLLQDAQGHLWFASEGGGVSRYDGRHFTTFSIENGLAHNQVWSMLMDREEQLWFGTRGGGVCRYDGQHFTIFTTEEGLADNTVLSILEDRAGNLWFGTMAGVSRYDGQTFTTFNAKDDLAGNVIESLLEDRQGHLWFGTRGGGVSRYDGQTFITFTKRDGLANNGIMSILEDSQGHIWFGTWGGGVSCYDGQHFTALTTKSGLAHNEISSLLQDRQQHLWCATLGGGVSRYDGQIFQSLLEQDGLGSNVVKAMMEDEDGYIWFATTRGVTRYSPPPPFAPAIFIDGVVADHRYENQEDVVIPASVQITTFEFHAISFKTRPQAIVYRYRLKGHEESWKNAKICRIEYFQLPIGSYAFEIQAVDRDQFYSEQSVVNLTVERDLRDKKIDELEQRVQERTRELEETHYKLEGAQAQIIAELEGQLQTAHDMQMKLMPAGSPDIEGFDISGRCIPASHVGGDFFQYFQQSGKLALCLADVTGHAMEAAVPVMMFSGILDSQMETGNPLEDIFANLNRSLHRNLDRRTFICFAMAELDLDLRVLKLINVGCPPLYHFRHRTDEIVELDVGGYPLGVRPQANYVATEIDLGSGDRVVFCSDGIIESTNNREEPFGFDRTKDTIYQGCRQNLSSERLIDSLIERVRDFAGDVSQEDDMTCVVMSAG